MRSSSSLMTELKNKLSDYDYDLPPELIAEYPSAKRPEARLMRLNRMSDKIEHGFFYDLITHLNAGDVLVLNDTRVIPARLLGVRKSGGKLEAFLLEEFEPGVWEALLKPSSRIRQGARVRFEGQGEFLEGEILDEARSGSGIRKIRFEGTSVREKIRRIGHMPLPPYIRREDEPSDRENYQTVFARHEGAVAAPTAGLHFDEALLHELKAKGVLITTVTLHTGYGTFQPVNTDDILQHRMFEEAFDISEESADIINTAKQEGRRVIACGTTSVRALESAVDSKGLLKPQRGRTALFIYPPFHFQIVEGLITNFHLPKSTLLMLVSAFSGYDLLRDAYRIAVQEKYRFYSYGDAMLIL